MTGAESLSLETMKVAVVGLGVMGRGIARVFAAAGAEVVATDATPEIVAVNAQRLADEASQDGDAVAVNTVDDLAECVTGAAVVVEAVSERPEVKSALLAELAKLLPDDVIIATNTSSLSISDLGRQYGRPEQVVGMHFFNPPTRMRLIEVIRGAQTSDVVLARALALSDALGKVGVLCEDSPGFIVNRCCRPLYYESQLLYGQHVEPAVIDTLARRVLGHRMGPLETIDIAGLHTHLIASESALREFGDPKYRPIPVVRRLVRAGFTGRGVGRGFYDYSRETPREARERVSQLSECEPAAVSVTGPDAASLSATPKGGVGNERVSVYRTTTSTAEDTRAVRVLSERGPVVVDSSDGGWIDALPDGVGWIHLHEREGEVTVEVVADSVAGITPTAAVFGVVAAFDGTALEVPALPGLIADRLGYALVNEATSFVQEGLAAPEAVDDALTLGMNHARGPFAYLDQYGPERILQGLRRLQALTGDERYRPTSHLSRLAAGAARGRI